MRMLLAKLLQQCIQYCIPLLTTRCTVSVQHWKMYWASWSQLEWLVLSWPDVNPHSSVLSLLPAKVLAAGRPRRFARLVRPLASSSSVLTIMWLMRFLSLRISFCSWYGTSGMTAAITLVNSSTKFYNIIHTFVCINTLWTSLYIWQLCGYSTCDSQLWLLTNVGSASHLAIMIRPKEDIYNSCTWKYDPNKNNCWQVSTLIDGWCCISWPTCCK